MHMATDMSNLACDHMRNDVHIKLFNSGSCSAATIGNVSVINDIIPCTDVTTA